MKRFMHYIAVDIEEIRGYPRWQWLYIPNGIMRLTALLKTHAKMDSKYPEEENE